MPQRRHTVDQIVAKLRKADVELGTGQKSARNLQVVRSLYSEFLNRPVIDVGRSMVA